MPQIPSATRIDRATPSGQQAVVRPDMSNADMGLGDLGQSLTQVSGDLKQAEMIDRQAAVTSADLTMATSLEKGSRAFDERTDHSNFIDDYDKDATEAMGIAGVNIDPRDRVEWEARQKLKIEKGRTRVMGVQRVKLRDEARASFTGQLRDAREAALTGDAGETAGLVENMTESMVLQGFMDREEAEKAVVEFKEDAAVGRLRMMLPENRLDALKEPFITENLPSDKVATLTREAMAESVKIRAVDTVDAIPEDATREEGQDIIDAIEDPRERLAAEARFNSEYAANEAAKTEKRLALYNDLHLKVGEKGGGFSYTDITSEQLSQLKPSERVSLQATEIQASKPRTVSDPATFNAATRMSARGNWEGLREFLTSNGSNLSGTDLKSFTKSAEEAIAPASVTTQQVLNGLLPGSDNKDMRDGLLLRMNSWRNEWVQSVGSEPKQADIEKEVLRRTKDLVNAKGKSGFWADLEPIFSFDVEATQRAELLDQVTWTEMEGENPEAYKTLGDYMASQGMVPNDRFQAQAVWGNQKAKWQIQNSTQEYVIEYGRRADAIFEEANIDNPSNEQWLAMIGKIKAQEATSAAE